jgi:hypothetical protein
MITGTLTISMIGTTISQPGIPIDRALQIIDSIKQGISPTLTFSPKPNTRTLTIMAQNVQAIDFTPEEGQQL